MTHTPLHIFVPHCSDMLTDHLPNGDGLVAYGFVKHLALQGHNVYVAALRAELHDPLPPNLHLTVITPRLKNRALARLEYMVRVRLLFNQIRRDHPIDLIHQLNPVFAGLSLAFWGIRLPLILGTFVARWPSETGTLTSQNGLMGWIASRLRDGIADLQQRPADVLLLTTPAALNRLPRSSAMQHKVRWLGHGIDEKLFSPAFDAGTPDRLDFEQRNPSILFLANLSERKGIFTLLHSFPTILDRIPHCRLTIAGDGESMSEARQLSDHLGISGQVDFLGATPRALAPNLFRSHAVYCLPSFGEPYATSILEAMGCARPIVITDEGGLPYMVPDEGGTRVPSGDAPALASALFAILTDPDRRRTMGAVNRRRILDTMTWPSIIDNLEGIYDEALQHYAERATPPVRLEPANRPHLAAKNQKQERVI